MGSSEGLPVTLEPFVATASRPFPTTAAPAPLEARTMTTTAILDRVPVDRISERAREVRPAPVLLQLIGGFFWLLGFLTAKLFAGLWVIATWTFSAMSTGWTDALGPSKRAQILLLEQEVAELRLAFERQR